MKKVIILGAGISGLTLAWYLKQRFGDRLSIKILEKSNRVGGWIQTIRHQDFLFELGPHSCRPTGNGESTLRLIQSLGMQDQVILPNSNSMKRYLWKNKKLQPVPHNLLGALFSPLMRGIPLTLLREWFIPRNQAQDESIYEFVLRRFGKSAVSLIDPLVTGIFAGDIKKLSIKSCFPLLHAWEEQYGSVLLGAIKHKRKPQTIKTPFFSLKDGLGSLTTTLGQRLDREIEKNSTVGKLHICTDSIAVETTDGRQWEADHVYSTLPAHVLGDLVDPSFHSIASATVSVVSLGYRHNVLKKDGFGYLVPSDEKEDILGMIWDSSIFSQQNSTKDETRLTIMLGGTHRPDICNLDDSELIDKALSACSRHLNIDIQPEAIHVHKAISAIPQYNVGHSEKLAHLHSYSTRLTCFGTTFNGVAVNDCIAHAEHLSTKIL